MLTHFRDPELIPRGSIPHSLTTFKNTIADWASIATFALSIFIVIYNMFLIEKISRQEKGFYLPIDFVGLNLPLLCVTALYIMYFNNSNQVLNYVASGLFALVTLMYLVTFFWIFKEQRQKAKIDFKYGILVIINVLIFLALALLIVIHLTNIIYIPTEILVFIFSTLVMITSPIFKSLFKPTVEDPLKDDEKENIK